MMDERDMESVEQDLHEWLGTRVEGELTDAIVVLSRTLITVFAMYTVKLGIMDPIAAWMENQRTMDQAFVPALAQAALNDREDVERVN